jgi:hypothetical protein
MLPKLKLEDDVEYVKSNFVSPNFRMLVKLRGSLRGSDLMYGGRDGTVSWRTRSRRSGSRNPKIFNTGGIGRMKPYMNVRYLRVRRSQGRV